MIRRALKRIVQRLAPRVPGARRPDRTPPTTRAAWQATAAADAPAAAKEPSPEPESEVDLEVEAETVAEWSGAGRAFLLVDIREPHEVLQGFADGALLVPMNDIPSSLAALPADRTLVIYCAAGVRSFGVTHWLRENGFEDTWSLVGGLGAWLSTGAGWTQPDRSAPFRPLERVVVAAPGTEALPPPGTAGRVQAVRADGADVLFTLSDGRMPRQDKVPFHALASADGRR